LFPGVDDDLPGEIPGFRRYANFWLIRGYVTETDRKLLDKEGVGFLTDTEREAFREISDEIAYNQIKGSMGWHNGDARAMDRWLDISINAASDWYDRSEVALGQKFHVIVQSLNYGWLGDASNDDPSRLSNPKLQTALNINQAQITQIRNLIDPITGVSKKRKQKLLERIQQLRRDSRAEILAKLTNDQRSEYDKFFGQPFEIFDTESRRSWKSVVDAYYSNDPITVTTGREYSAASEGDVSDRKQTVSDESKPRTIRIDSLENSMINNQDILDDLKLDDSQRKKLKDTVHGNDLVLELTYAARDTRMVKLFEGLEPLEASPLEDLLTAEQKQRFAQVEMQVLTIDEIGSFGLLDPIVKWQLELTKKQATEISEIVKGVESEIKQLVVNNNNETETARNQLLTRLIDVLNDQQKAKYQYYLGDSANRTKIFETAVD
jgi:hypothetical protein